MASAPGTAVATTLATLCSWLATLETAVAALLVTLSTSVVTGGIMPLLEAACRETTLAKLNCRVNVNELTAISRRMQEISLH
jgi:membrane-associated HD superfamily phosphohydrolase